MDNHFPAELAHGDVRRAGERAATAAFSSTGPSGHRSRMRARVLERGAPALADYEILEMLLFLGIARRDTKPLAKALINRFGSLHKVLEADRDTLAEAGLNPASVAALRLPLLAATRLAGAEARSRPQLGDWEALLVYFDTALGGAVPGQLRILYLDNRNRLLGDEAVNIDASRSAPRVESAAILRRALQLHATAMIGVRLCGDADVPEKRVLADSALASELSRSGALLAIAVHDFFALKGGAWAGLRRLGKL